MTEELLEKGHKGAEYDAWPIRIGEGEQFGSGFVDINPNSKIPALVDRRGNNRFACSNRARSSSTSPRSSASSCPRLAPSAPRRCPGCLANGQRSLPRRRFGHFFAYAPVKIEYAINRYAMEAKRQLDVLNRQLANNEYIAGTDYTIADIAIWPWYGGIALGRSYEGAVTFLATHEYEHLMRWAKQIAERPAVKRGRIVNRMTGEPAEQLHERHDASDFELRTQDKLLAVDESEGVKDDAICGGGLNQELTSFRQKTSGKEGLRVTDCIKTTSEARWLSGLVVLTLASNAVAIVVGTVANIPMGEFYRGYFLAAEKMVLPAMLFFAIPISIGAMLRRVEHPFRALRNYVAGRFGSLDEAIGTLLPVPLMILMLAAVGIMKQIMPLVAPFSWDDTFANAGRFLLFGHQAWQITHALFGSPRDTQIINFIYFLWLPFLFFSVLGFATIAPRYTQRDSSSHSEPPGCCSAWWLPSCSRPPDRATPA